MSVDDETSAVGRIMDKAERSDGQALFAALQAALLTVTDLYYSVDRPHGPGLDVILRRTEEALDVGAPYGSPEQLEHVRRKAEAARDSSSTTEREEQ